MDFGFGLLVEVLSPEERGGVVGGFCDNRGEHVGGHAQEAVVFGGNRALGMRFARNTSKQLEVRVGNRHRTRVHLRVLVPRTKLEPERLGDIVGSIRITHTDNVGVARLKDVSALLGEWVVWETEVVDNGYRRGLHGGWGVCVDGGYVGCLHLEGGDGLGV